MENRAKNYFVQFFSTNFTIEQNLIALFFRTFLEHIFKKMGSTEIVVSSVRPSVRLSVRPSPIFQPL
jgi:hypothetical protein